MHADMVESYVRDLLERLTGVRPEPDHDGDLPVQLGGALFNVRVDNPADPVVQVFSVAVADSKSTAKLNRALNDINARLRFTRIFHVRDQVLIESEIWGSDVNANNLEYACRSIAAATDAFGT